MQRIKSLGVLSVAKISGLCYGAMGLLFVPVFLLFTVAASVAGKQATGTAGAFPASIGIVFALFMPIFYGAFGFLFGALGAFLYNVIARWIGGIEIDIETAPVIPSAQFQTNI